MDTWIEPRGDRESGALCWSSANELGFSPGIEGAHGNQEKLHRNSSAREQLLCKAQQG